ncbi:hypothetical protein PsYK624_095080 [Phanerochaete sordida]|uniref:MYND-type domain-containing protein n=1 Tax=Phanerochaete sordida TaxID=48140 RepID=A0A9P3GGR2_9APHY|nr:hypothetical protein PsYK624_095080 [Phanerochaete sordida]
MSPPPPKRPIICSCLLPPQFLEQSYTVDDAPKTHCHFANIMFVLLYKLFPGKDLAQGVSREVMRDRLFQVPKLWTGLMQELCIADVDARSLWVPSTVLGDAVRCAPEPAWRAAWETGFATTLVQLIRSSYLFGLTRDQLVAAPDASRMGRCAMMLNLLSACVRRMMFSNCEDELTQLSDVFQNTITMLYVKLWDVREPFLVAQPASSTFDPDNRYASTTEYLNGIHTTLNVLGDVTVYTLRKHRYIGVHESCMPHIYLAIWLYSPNTRARAQALTNMSQLNGVEGKSTSDSWTEFFRSANLGAVGDAQIAQAILRDLTEEKVVDADLHVVFAFLSVWQCTYIRDGKLPLDERRLGSCCLAAARRTLCRGSGSDLKMDVEVLKVMFNNLRIGSMASRRQCYVFFDLLCHCALLLIQTENHIDGPLLVATNSSWVCDRFSSLIRDDSPKTAAMAQHSLKAWQAVTDEITDRQLAAVDAQWRRFVSIWKRPRSLMLSSSLSSQPAQSMSFSPLERCAWAPCLCSRHKPAHRMRVCKGCERVAYCGELCQQR